jgi:hypothetical protein
MWLDHLQKMAGTTEQEQDELIIKEIYQQKMKFESKIGIIT